MTKDRITHVNWDAPPVGDRVIQFRRGDGPSLSYFAPTLPSWKRFMRVLTVNQMKPQLKRLLAELRAKGD